MDGIPKERSDFCICLSHLESISQILPLYRPSRFHASAIIIIHTSLHWRYWRSSWWRIYKKQVNSSYIFIPIHPLYPHENLTLYGKGHRPRIKSISACLSSPAWMTSKQATSQTNTKNTRSKETKTNDTQYSNQKVKKQRSKQANKQADSVTHTACTELKTQLWKGWQIKHWESLEVSVVDQDLHHKNVSKLIKKSWSPRNAHHQPSLPAPKHRPIQYRLRLAKAASRHPIVNSWVSHHPIPAIACVHVIGSTFQHQFSGTFTGKPLQIFTNAATKDTTTFRLASSDMQILARYYCQSNS